MASPERRNSVSKPAIDREKTTPFLLRLFVRTGGFHRLEEFEAPDRMPVEDEVQIYTWKDITLLELSKLISSAFPQISKPNTRLAFRLIFTDSWRPRVLLKDVGTVNMSPPQDPNNTGGEDAGSRTLEDVKYVIGDWIDVAIFNNSQGGPGSRPYDGPRGGSFSRGGGERGRGRGGMDSYRGGGGSGRGRGGRNGYDSYGGGDRDRDGGDDRGPPRGPRPDRDRGGRW